MATRLAFFATLHAAAVGFPARRTRGQFIGRDILLLHPQSGHSIRESCLPTWGRSGLAIWDEVAECGHSPRKSLQPKHFDNSLFRPVIGCQLSISFRTEPQLTRQSEDVYAHPPLGLPAGGPDSPTIADILPADHRSLQGRPPKAAISSVIVVAYPGFSPPSSFIPQPPPCSAPVSQQGLATGPHPPPA